MYDLVADGLVDIRRFVRPRKIARDPLSGVIDGVNTYFFSSYSPLFQSTTPSLYEGATAVSSGSYSVDYDAGLITVTEPPDSQLYLTYDLVAYTNTELKRILMEAFDEMESRYPRDWRLSSGSTAYAEATENSSAIYVLDGTTVSDPATGDKTFSTSRLQRGFFWACIEYILALRKLDEAADGFLWREDRGVTVDKSRVAQNRMAQLEFIQKRLEMYRTAAMDEHDSTGGHYGEYQASPGTKQYFYDYEWQTDSRDEGWRTTYAGNV